MGKYMTNIKILYIVIPLGKFSVVLCSSCANWQQWIQLKRKKKSEFFITNKRYVSLSKLQKTLIKKIQLTKYTKSSNST
jgi:hypothetical protein